MDLKFMCKDILSIIESYIWTKESLRYDKVVDELNKSLSVEYTEKWDDDKMEYYIDENSIESVIYKHIKTGKSLDVNFREINKGYSIKIINIFSQSEVSVLPVEKY